MWKKVKLGDVVEINPTVLLKRDNSYSFIEMADLSEGQKFAYPSTKKMLTGGARFQESDTLFARITPCLENGKICQAKNLENGVGFGSTEFHVFRGKEGISDTDYVFYLARTDYVRKYAEQNLVGTSGRQRVSANVLLELEVDLPPLPTQTRIASILSTLDDKIGLNRQMNHTLEQIAQALFKKYFVDEGDPENLPEGWRTGKLEEIIVNFDSKRIPLSSRERAERKGIYPYHGATAIMDYVSDYLFDGLFVLLGEDGTVVTKDGFPVLQYTWGKFWVNNHAHVLQGKGHVSTNFIYLLLKNTQVAHLVTGAVQPKINQGNLNSINVVIPDKETILKFDSIVDSFYDRYRSNIEENKVLEKIRNSLLPKVMSGEIEIKEAETLVA